MAAQRGQEEAVVAEGDCLVAARGCKVRMTGSSIASQGVNPQLCGL